MSTSLEQLKRTFFDECAESMQDIETGLTEIKTSGANDDTVNAVFRAVHSVKGGAGIFGFEALVEFAHVFETTLDAIRRHTLEATPDVLDVLLSSSDVLSDLITMSRGGEDIPHGFGEMCRVALERLVDPAGAGAAAAEEEAPIDFDDLDFTPVMVDDMGSDNDGRRSVGITFRPRPEFLRAGGEPLAILRDLRGLGELAVIAEFDDIPALEDFEVDACHIGWTGALMTSANPAEIEAVLSGARGDCDVSIDDPLAGTPVPVAAMPPAVDEPVAIPTPLGLPGGWEPVADMAEATPMPAEMSAPAPAITPAPGAPMPAMPMPAMAAPVSVPSAASVSAPANDAGARGGGGKGASATTTRIELEKIDRVVNMVGELVIAQAMLGQIVQDLPSDVSGRLTQVLEEVSHHTRELKDSIMSMRAQPVASVFQRMPRLVRELAGKTGKKVKLEMVGESTEVDRSVIERLTDPLTHIIRNSVDHGIEAPADRLTARKPEEGTIRLSAEHRGGRIVIEVVDDGGGINTDRVLAKARERKLVAPDAVLSDDEIANLIFLPGFSTAETISDISGRGVGMDVVRSNIQDLGGRISLKSERGRGMKIQFALPLTLAVMDGMVIKAGRDTYVVPMSSIVECLRPTGAEIKNLVGTRGMLNLRGDLVPIAYLSDLLDLNSPPGDDSVVIIVEAGDDTRIGLVVDELCGHQQVVIKSIEDSYGVVPGIAAATILGNGRVAFILDVEKISDLAGTEPPAHQTGSGGPMLQAAE